MSQRHQLPEPTKRIVRKEAFFGCVVCGNPIIEYAHIIPYGISRDDRVGNLVALCPTHHTRYDLGGISEDKMRAFKSNPFNKGRDVVDRFDIEGDVPIIEAGTNIFKNTPVLLVVDNRNIVTLSKEEDELLLNAVFYDKNNDLLAFIKDNEWCALSGMAWDIEYHTVAKALVIRTKPRNILLRLRIRKGVIHFSGLLYYNGLKVRISPSKIMFGNNVMTWKRCKFENCITAIHFDTQTGSFGIASSVHEHEYRKPICVTLMQGSDLLRGRIYQTYYIMRECRFCNQIAL